MRINVAIDDPAAVIEALDLNDASLVGHSLVAAKSSAILGVHASGSRQRRPAGLPEVLNVAVTS
jgi:hypothetical protein